MEEILSLDANTEGWMGGEVLGRVRSSSFSPKPEISSFVIGLSTTVRLKLVVDRVNIPFDHAAGQSVDIFRYQGIP